MKKIIILIICLLLSGCSHLFNSIQPDILMKKKIETNTTHNIPDYKGILSVDTIKELSINSVNTYLQQNLELDKVVINVQFYDIQSTLQYLYGWTNISSALPDENAIKEKFKEGIFLVNILSDLNSYQVILMAASGELQQVTTLESVSNSYEEKEINIDEIILVCQDYIEEVLSINPKTVDFNIKSIIGMYNYEFDFYNKESKKYLFSLEINASTKQIMRYSVEEWVITKPIIIN